MRDPNQATVGGWRRRDFLSLAAASGAALMPSLGLFRALAQDQRGRAPLKIRSVDAHVIRIAARSNIVCAPYGDRRRLPRMG